MSIDTENHDDLTNDAGHSESEHAESAHGEHDEHGLSDRGYVGIAIILAIMTAAEVAISYLDLPGWMFMSGLLVLMVVKFVMVVSFFMHLKFDSKIFTWLFYSGLILAVAVYGVMLATFQFFSRS